jgi:MFS family permease
VIIGGLVSGPLLDRFDRRKVMIVDNLLRGTVFALIPLFHSLGMLALWHIYVVASVYGFLMMISLAGGPALIPSLVKPEEQSTANALEMLSFTVGGVLGPALAGFLIPKLGAPTVVLVDALSYFAYALALLGIRLLPSQTQHASEQGYGLGDALRLFLQNPILRTTTLMYMTFNIGAGLLSVWLPILTDQVLKGGPTLYGLLLATRALGETSSSLWAGGWRPRWSLGSLICLFVTLCGVSLLGLLVGQVWVAVLALFFFGFFDAPLTIWAQTLRMQVIPEHLRGRSFALIRTLIQGTNPIGGALGGLLLPVLGIPAMIGFSALLVGGPGLLGSQVLSLRQAGKPLEGQVEGV